jgi:hypothetical protein
VSEKSPNAGGVVHSIGPNGELRVIEGTGPQAEPSPAKMVADKLNIPYNEAGGNGNMTTHDAGKIGGHLGGPMVRKMVNLAREEIARGHVNDLIHRSQK